MKEWINKAAGPLTMIGMMIVIALIVSLVIHDAINDDTFDKEYFIIDGSVLEAIPVSDESGKLDYLHVYFDNGDDYKIKTSSHELDLTVNSKLILELYRYPNWDEYDEYVYVGTVIKVPEP